MYLISEVSIFYFMITVPGWSQATKQNL